jgi:hypothetical protein
MAPAAITTPVASQAESSKFQPFPAHATSLEYAQSLDAADPLRSFREKFIIPSKENLKATKLAKPGMLLNHNYSTLSRMVVLINDRPLKR